ncbi:ecto-ADP-ribosyltransferase 5-like [Ctenopharyngodon idella]|uniref:ecto-ADP-ribosyltransferase 5-like n=1 Tax=Ctenopharyngodon idella TaxID=7959 RepID=UPI0022315E74|nr:ecto-ADP-ribosyltransferase 5-like [Ctenopharyngodon idella]XP_051745466.1 ecto-ADP-ribosyltransferase 5-like [Ctenopharyngodon idella]
MLLIVEALLLISAALAQDHRTAAAEGQIFPLDMAENSVDDCYVGCKKNMSCLVETELLERELNNSTKFRMVWQDAEKNHEPPADNLTENHSIAIHVYTNSRVDIYQELNDAVYSDKQQYKDSTYTWYSLQFLLTEAIQILKESQNRCKSTYRGTNDEFDKNVLNKQVRFGLFSSSSLEIKPTKPYGNVSCFEIYTCEGADVSKYSTFPEEKEVLIPPYEKFNVIDVKTIIDYKDLWCETVFVLESAGVRSDLNCALLNRPTKSIRKS